MLKNENRSVQKISQAFLHGSLLAGIDGLGLDLTQKSSKSDYFWDKIDVIGRITVGSLIFDFYENLKIIIYEAWNVSIVWQTVRFWWSFGASDALWASGFENLSDSDIWFLLKMHSKSFKKCFGTNFFNNHWIHATILISAKYKVFTRFI